MASVDLIMPKMGESIMEATILNWVKKEGDPVALDETILEIATDKVDSEIPSPVAGVMGEILFKENDVVPVGTVIARILTEARTAAPKPSPAVTEPTAMKKEVSPPPPLPQNGASNGRPAGASERPVNRQPAVQVGELSRTSAGRFYSPLVRNIAKQEGIDSAELDRIPGSGLEGRFTKRDILDYVGS
jgi:2-oxoglutarate dehydrogenase E2 component (dihydrolipoamide succinyltransferase)